MLEMGTTPTPTTAEAFTKRIQENKTQESDETIGKREQIETHKRPNGEQMKLPYNLIAPYSTRNRQSMV